MKINLGGMGEKEGFIDVGLWSEAKIITNLDDYPLPFEDNSISEIYCSHTLEHLHKPLDFLGECYRIMKKGAIMTIRVPHVSALKGCFGNMEHKHFYHEHAISTVTNSNSTIINYRFKHINTKVIRAKWLKWRKYEIQWVIKK